MPANLTSVRTVESTNSTSLQLVEQPFSFFNYLESVDDLRGLLPLHRICSQARKLGAQTIITEHLRISDDVKEENADITKRFSRFSESRVWRLSFFEEKISSLKELDKNSNKGFIGYAVVKTDILPPPLGRRTRVLESVILKSQHENNYIRNAPKWKCCVAGRTFTVEGYLYAQQNGITNICAHVALRTVAARFHQNGDISYREINDLLGINHISKKIGWGENKGWNENGGLETWEICKVLETIGAECLRATYKNPITEGNSVPFQKLLYGSIESGYPAILCFAIQKERHAIPVFGHTFNEDIWVPSAEALYFKVGPGTRYIPSELWTSMFITHDDNFGSNFCIPRHYLYTRLTCGRDQQSESPYLCPIQQERVFYVIATFPKLVKVNSVQAEVIAIDYLRSILEKFSRPTSDPWIKRLRIYATNGSIVLRPILIKGLKEYGEHLRKVRNWEGDRFNNDVTKTFIQSPGDDFFWMVEISVPELFSANNRKLGEILLKAQVPVATTRDFGNFLLTRIPGHFVFYVGGEMSNPEYRYVPCGLDNHIELYRCEKNS
ncbi:MAG: hypothetical protein V2A65_07915 [Candidatus Omnitrophota bacterium]